MIRIILTAFQFACFDSSDYIFDDFKADGVDTVAIENYTGYFHYRYLDDHKINFFIQIKNDTNVVLERGSFEVGLYNFCQGDSNLIDPCYLKDIDGDSLPEVILRCYSGGNHCCEDLIVFSLDDSAIKRDSIKTDYMPFGIIKDLDGDSIPEYSWSDPSWDWWKTFRTAFETGQGRYFPTLVWKWNGNNYRIANFQFPEEVLIDYIKNLPKKLEAWEIPDSAQIGYDPGDSTPVFPPPELTNLMVAYLYAGDSLRADSLFEAYWPDDIPGKDEFYSDFKKMLLSTPYWKEINESTWR